MQLKLKRSQRSGMMGKILFALDARLELTGEEKSLIQKYKLGKQSIYDSENRKKYAGAAADHMDASLGSDGGSVAGAGNAVYRYGRGLLSAAMAGLSLKVTMDSLCDGQHIECKDLDELLGAEGAIREACTNMRAYLETAQLFDGREEIIAY